MSLVLRWRVPDPPLTLRWRGPAGMLDAVAKYPAMPIAAIVGPPGPPGPVDTFYTHTQASASALWTVNHNRGAEPIVSVLSPGGAVIEAEIQHVSENQFQVILSAPHAGRAIAR